MPPPSRRRGLRPTGRGRAQGLRSGSAGPGRPAGQIPASGRLPSLPDPVVRRSGPVEAGARSDPLQPTDHPVHRSDPVGGNAARDLVGLAARDRLGGIAEVGRAGRGGRGGRYAGPALRQPPAGSPRSTGRAKPRPVRTRRATPVAVDGALRPCLPGALKGAPAHQTARHSSITPAPSASSIPSTAPVKVPNRWR